VRARPLASPGMLRASVLVSTLVALACAGCAASPPPAVTPPPRLVLAEATPEPTTTAEPNTIAPALSPPPADAESEHKARQMNRVWGWTFLSVGIDGAILATVTSAMMLHQASVRSSECADKVCNTDGIAANGKLHDMAPWNAGAWVAAVVGIPVGVYLLLTNPTDKALHAEVGAGPTGSGSGLIVRGAF
jgi:hypothetical protein